MNCMKCGAEIEAGQVFCLDCQAEMVKYPVEPGAVVLLPPKQEAAPPQKKLPHRRTPTPEEQVKGLRKAVRILALGWLITAVLLGLTVGYLFTHLPKDKFLPGQNYSSITSTESNVSHETSIPTDGK